VFVFECHNNLRLNPLFLEIYKQFQFYKEDSAADEHAAPNNYIQKTYHSIHPLFGRDRFDKVNKTANVEEIQHLHVREELSIWEDKDGRLCQWECTSDTHLIYSYFYHQDTHYYYLIEFYNKAAHLQYVDDVLYLIQEAKKYRLSIIGDGQTID
jgi:hypothetical protein